MVYKGRVRSGGWGGAQPPQRFANPEFWPQAPETLTWGQGGGARSPLSIPPLLPLWGATERSLGWCAPPPPPVYTDSSTPSQAVRQGRRQGRANARRALEPLHQQGPTAAGGRPRRRQRHPCTWQSRSADLPGSSALPPCPRQARGSWRRVQSDDSPGGAWGTRHARPPHGDV